MYSGRFVIVYKVRRKEGGKPKLYKYRKMPRQ